MPVGFSFAAFEIFFFFLAPLLSRAYGFFFS